MFLGFKNERDYARRVWDFFARYRGRCYAYRRVRSTCHRRSCSRNRGLRLGADRYAYLAESLGAWEQRPTLKANLDQLHEIRRCAPAVPLTDLRALGDIFKEPDAELELDPSYEPTLKPKNAKHEATFAALQRCRAAKLVEPVGTPHMYDAAAQSLPCRLTPLGRHYWRLATEGLI